MPAPLGKKVYTIVNYGNFDIAPELIDEYSDMVKQVMQFYESTTCYTTSTFLRMKLGNELAKRDVVPHISRRENVPCWPSWRKRSNRSCLRPRVVFSPGVVSSLSFNVLFQNFF